MSMGLVNTQHTTGLTFGVSEIKGLEDALENLARVKVSVLTVLPDALLHGAWVITRYARWRGPGEHIYQVLARRQRASDPVAVWIGPDDKHFYYRFFELGAAAHEIKPRMGRRRMDGSAGSALKFQGEDGEVFRGQVHHPGVTPRPFLRPAFDSQVGTFVERVKERLAAEIARQLR